MDLIGKRIREQRLKMNLTIEKLAEKAEISENFMGNIERGEDFPRLKNFINIANILCVDADYLLQDYLTAQNELKPINRFYAHKIVEELETLSEKQQNSVLRFIEIIKEYE